MDPKHRRAEPARTQDGRSERGVRNRESILDAVYQLVEREERMPTAERVAEEAGVGIRTVFRHFSDMEALYSEVWTRVYTDLRDVIDAPLPEGSLEQRTRVLVDRRCELFERMAPFRRAAVLQKDKSAFLQRQRQQVTAILRMRLMRVFPEIEAAPPALVEALDMVSSFEAWNRLKVDQGLSNVETRVAVETAFLLLLRAAIQ